MILRVRRQPDESVYTNTDSVDAGWQPKNANSVTGTMYHELAHVLSHWTEEEIQDELLVWLGEYYKDNTDIDKFPDFRDKALLKAMAKEASGYSFRYDNVDAGVMSSNVPQAIDFHEFTSEAFADFEINGENAWELSKFIHAKMTEVFDKYAK